MLEVTFNVHTGACSPIPEETHELRLTHLHRLSHAEQLRLRQYIIKHRLDVGIHAPVTSTPTKTRQVIAVLEQFVKENRQHALSWYEGLIGWSLIALMFAVPIYLAYHLSGYLEAHIFEPLLTWISALPNMQQPWLQQILFGDYGILSLGTYSFVWALPVVILMSISTAVLDHSGLKAYVMNAIEPSMRRIGLTGMDIVPLLEGFGCNAAAVTQAAHQCSACTKARCVSLIGFGTSCSYQIGATLSIFNTAQMSWLFVPYLCMVFVGGIIHNRIWYPPQNGVLSSPMPVYQGMHWPWSRAFMKQIWATIQMFIVQAMPIFIGICFMVSLLSFTPILEMLAKVFAPLLRWVQLPTDLATGIFFSMIRKDGMLLFNTNHGALIQSLSPIQLLMVVFLASTITACSVTMTMMVRHFGSKIASQMIAKQMLTSIGCVVILFIGLQVWQVIISHL